MNRIDAIFRELKQRGQVALMPFLAAGDPDLRTTADLILECARQGADLIELGVPFSDPVADGPVIQTAFTRALSKGLRLEQILDWLKSLRPRTDIGILSMVSYSIVFRHGPGRYVREAAKAGFDGAIIPDLPVEESRDVLDVANDLDFPIAFLVAPTTPEDRAREIVKLSRGFVYYVSVAGITGARDRLPADIEAHVAGLKSVTSLPVAVGFGVSNPQQVAELSRFADGVIVGSAIVKEIESSRDLPGSELVRRIGRMVQDLSRPTKRGRR